MKLENPIGWCDATGNPGIGCRGCELGDDCYAKFDTPARVLRAGKWPGRAGEKTETFGKGRVFVPTIKGLSDLRRLTRLCICDNCHTTWPFEKMATDYCHSPDGPGICRGELRRIRFFADSNSDWMDWPIDVLAAGMDEIRQAPNVSVILLTKWPELWRERIQSAMDYAAANCSKTDSDLVAWLDDWCNHNKPPSNVLIITSVLGNAFDERRIQNVLKISAAVRGLSCEPLWAKPGLEDWVLEPAQFRDRYFDWIIVGCDSSKHHKGWENYEANAGELIEQCRAAGIRVYHKQMPIAGRVSQNKAEWPEDLRIQQWPQRF